MNGCESHVKKIHMIALESQVNKYHTIGCESNVNKCQWFLVYCTFFHVVLYRNLTIRLVFCTFN